MTIKDPTAVCKFGRINKVLILENHLSAIQDYENAQPYGIHSPYSVFKLKHLESGKCVSTNIPPKKLADIQEKSRFANNAILKVRMSGAKAGQEELPSCYTAKIMLGDASIKGKTPAQVMLDNPENAAQMLQTKKYLQENLNNPANAKYKASNEKLIMAIDEAIALYKKGELEKKENAGTRMIPIYVEECKVPNIKKLDKNKNTEVYSIKIYCNPVMDNPFVIQMMNCMAPVENNDVVLAKAVQKNETKFVLTDSEWNTLLQEMVETEYCFRVCHFNKVDKTVSEYLQQQRELAKEKN